VAGPKVLLAAASSHPVSLRDHCYCVLLLWSHLVCSEPSLLSWRNRCIHLVVNRMVVKPGFDVTVF
jgi:hypothetical protein